MKDTNPELTPKDEHSLMKFRKRIRFLQRFALVIVILAILIFVLWSLELFSFLDLMDTIFLIVMLSILFGVILFFAYSSKVDMTRTRYHRYHGPTRELTAILETYFKDQNLTYKKNNKYPYKLPYVPLTIYTINYKFSNYSINIYGSESGGGDYCELRIFPITPENKMQIDIIEKEIFELIKEKRGWQFQT